jgi:hypothetical protein
VVFLYRINLTFQQLNGRENDTKYEHM